MLPPWMDDDDEEEEEGAGGQEEGEAGGGAGRQEEGSNHPASEEVRVIRERACFFADFMQSVWFACRKASMLPGFRVLPARNSGTPVRV